MKESLDDEYAGTIERLQAQPGPQRQLALRVLFWLSHTFSALTSAQLLEALAINDQDRRVKSARKPPLQDVLGVCIGLVTVDPTSSTLSLFHFTLKEFLLSQDGVFSGMEHLGKLCLIYLSYDDFNNVCPEDLPPQLGMYKGRFTSVEGISADFWQKYPFSAYASQFWADHIRGSYESTIYSILLSFLKCRNILSAVQLRVASTMDEHSWDSMIFESNIEYFDDLELNDAFATYICTCYKLETTLRMLLCQGAGTNFRAPWDAMNTPLHVAVMLQYGGIVDALLNAKADVNVQDKWGLTSLHLDVRYNCYGDVSFVTKLLECGADPDIKDQDGRTALHLAVRHAEIDRIKNVLAKCNVNIQDEMGDAALHHAIRLDYADAIQVLLENGADPTLANNENKSCLAVALDHADYALLKNLLDTSSGKEYKFEAEDEKAARDFLSSIDEQKKERFEARTAALRKEDEARRRFNLRTPISQIAAAAEKGDYGALKRLLSQGADVNKQDEISGRTALHHAAIGGREKAIRYLLGAGADTAIVDREGYTAMQLADRYSPRASRIFDGPVLKNRLTRPLMEFM